MVVRKEQEENFLLEVLGFKGVKILGEELASKARVGLSQYHQVEADEVVLVRVGQRVKEVREVFQLVRDIDHHVLDVVGFHSGEYWGPRQILYFYCGKPGHIARDCWSKNRANESQVIEQSNIGKNMTQ